MQSILTDDFVAVPYMSGTIQNVNDRAAIEVSESQIKNSGLILYPGEKYEWANKQIYARSAWRSGEIVTLAAVPMLNSGGGSGGGGGSTVTVDVGVTNTGAPGTAASVTNAGTTQNAVFNFVIPQGKDGKDGKSFEIKAQYATEAALEAAHPTGESGDAYLVGTDNNPDLYLWLQDTSTGTYSWTNVGKIAGTKGDDGFSPTITFTDNYNGTYTVSVTNSTGTTTTTLAFVGGINDWATGKIYVPGNLVQQNGQIYRCTSAHTSATWALETSKWAIVSGLQVWATNTTYFAGSLLYCDGVLYKVDTTFTSTTTFSDANLTVVSGGLTASQMQNVYNAYGN